MLSTHWLPVINDYIYLISWESKACLISVLDRIARTAYIDAVYCYRPSSMVCRSICWSVCHTSEPCKNGWTDLDAVWVEDLGGPREPCIRWGPDPHGKEQFLGGKGRPIVKYRDTMRSSVQKRPLNRSRCIWVVGLDRPKESCIRWGPDHPWEGTILRRKGASHSKI